MAPPALVHTAFSAECNHQFDWFAVALFYSHGLSGQVGAITRLLACSAHELASYRGLSIGPTFVHPNLRAHPIIDEEGYPSYNKPGSLMFWLASAQVCTLARCVRRRARLAARATRRSDACRAPRAPSAGTARDLHPLRRRGHAAALAARPGRARRRARHGRLRRVLVPGRDRDGLCGALHRWQAFAQAGAGARAAPARRPPPGAASHGRATRRAPAAAPPRRPALAPRQPRAAPRARARHGA